MGWNDWISISSPEFYFWDKSWKHNIHIGGILYQFSQNRTHFNNTGTKLTAVQWCPIHLPGDLIARGMTSDRHTPLLKWQWGSKHVNLDDHLAAGIILHYTVGMTFDGCVNEIAIRWRNWQEAAPPKAVCQDSHLLMRTLLHNVGGHW